MEKKDAVDKITNDKLSFDKKVKYFILRYIQEILEAFIAHSLFRLISDKPFMFEKTFKMSLIIGVITLILEEYNSNYKNNIKSGIMINIGSQFVKS